MKIWAVQFANAGCRVHSEAILRRRADPAWPDGRRPAFRPGSAFVGTRSGCFYSRRVLAPVDEGVRYGSIGSSLKGSLNFRGFR